MAASYPPARDGGRYHGAMPAPRVALCLALSLSLALTLTAPARADTLRMKDGKDLFAAVVEERPDGMLVLVTAEGRREVPRTDVRARVPSKDAKADLERLRRALHGRRDANALVDLAAWAGAQGLAEGRKETLALALDLDPQHARTHEALGHVLVDGRWVDRPAAAALPEADRSRAALLQRYADLLGTRPDVTVTDHFECADFLEDGKGPDRVADLERAWDLAKEVLGSDPWQGRALVVACRGEEQYRKWLDGEAAKFRGMSPPLLDILRKSTGMKWYEPKVLGRSNLPGTNEMHGANVHAVGHLLVCVWKRIQWKAPFWIEEGFGGWMEDRVLHTNSSYCFDVPTKAGYGGAVRGTKQWDVDRPDWKRLLKDAVADGSFLPLDQLDRLPRGEYSRREVGQSFALVAYLLDVKGKEKWREYLLAVKSGTPSPDAAMKVYGATWEGMEPDWKRYVADRW